MLQHQRLRDVLMLSHGTLWQFAHCPRSKVAPSRISSSVANRWASRWWHPVEARRTKYFVLPEGNIQFSSVSSFMLLFRLLVRNLMAFLVETILRPRTAQQLCSALFKIFSSEQTRERFLLTHISVFPWTWGPLEPKNKPANDPAIPSLCSALAKSAPSFFCFLQHSIASSTKLRPSEPVQQPCPCVMLSQ